MDTLTHIVDIVFVRLAWTAAQATVLIAALFCLYNRYVDGLGTYRPEDPAYYQRLAARLVTIGYGRPKDGIRNGEESFK